MAEPKKKFMKADKAAKLLEVREKPKSRSAGEVREKLYGKDKK